MIDLGTGSSMFTWLGMTGIAYGFSWGGCGSCTVICTTIRKTTSSRRTWASAALRWGSYFGFDPTRA
jgi:aerobic-type carbon monoxide dehydrogenase small subunit (CoxS/CutS family)